MKKSNCVFKKDNLKNGNVVSDFISKCGVDKIANQTNFEDKLLDVIDLDDENKEIVKLELKKKFSFSLGPSLRNNLSSKI